MLIFDVAFVSKIVLRCIKLEILDLTDIFHTMSKIFLMDVL